MTARQLIEIYNSFLISADELDRDIDHINIGSDCYTYTVAYQSSGRALLLINGHPAH